MVDYNRVKLNIIVNPAASGGRCGHYFMNEVLPVIKKYISVSTRVLLSDNPLHCTGLALLASNEAFVLAGVSGGAGVAGSGCGGGGVDGAGAAGSGCSAGDVDGAGAAGSGCDADGPGIGGGADGAGVASDVGVVNTADEQTFSIVAVAGGDGTVNDVIQTMSPSSLLIPFPCGNANDFSRRYGFTSVSRSIQTLIQAVKGRQPPSVMVDLGLVQYPSGQGLIERRFINHFGWGVSADVVHALHGRKLKMYKTRAVYEVLTRPAEAVELNADGKRVRTRAFGMEFLLADKIGRDVHFGPCKIPNDGSMDIIMFEDMPFISRADLLAKLKFGRWMVKKSRVQYISSNPVASTCSRWGNRIITKATLSTEAPGNYHLDGNKLGDIKCSSEGDLILVQVLPKALQVALSVG